MPKRVGPQWLATDLIPVNWVRVLEKRGAKVHRDSRYLRVSYGVHRRLSVGASVNTRGTCFWEVKVVWDHMHAPSQFCASAIEAASWIEDFVWGVENLDDLFKEISLPWKELMLTVPMKDRSDKIVPAPSENGFLLRKAVRHTNSYAWSVYYGYRYDKPWSVWLGGDWRHQWRHQTFRFKTLDGLMRRLVRTADELQEGQARK